MTKWRRTK